MAFLLRHLPDERAFARFSKLYPSLDPVSVSAFLRLLRVGSDLLGELDTLLATHGLSHGRWITLVLLRREDHMSALPRDLAEKQGVSKATMSGLLSGLEDAGLIRREWREEDARCAPAVLTEAGVQILDRVMPRYYDSVRQWLSPLSTSEQRSLIGLLDRLLGSLDQRQLMK
ncbi:MAG: MarR family transcriptional regulator [Planctomycetota bacterium]|nr:MarR family transcriptional regulator [Planctomycetota bacterium]